MLPHSAARLSYSGGVGGCTIARDRILFILLLFFCTCIVQYVYETDLKMIDARKKRRRSRRRSRRRRPGPGRRNLFFFFYCQRLRYDLSLDDSPASRSVWNQAIRELCTVFPDAHARIGGVAEPHTVSKILTAKNGWMGRQRKDEERDGGEDRLDDDADSGQQQRITSCHLT